MPSNRQPRQRRPVPEPAPTDDRKAIIVGLALWVLATPVCVVMGVRFGEPGWIATCAVALLIGVAGLVYTRRRRSR